MMPQATVPLTLRDFEPADYERLVEVNNANYPDYPNSVEEVRYWDSLFDSPKYHYKRYACLDQSSGKILGFGRVNHAMWNFHQQKFSVGVMVDPAHQGKGIGAMIYTDLAEKLKALHAVTAWAEVKEDMPRWIAFANNRGFSEKRRAWESRLNPSEVDVSRLQKYADEASRSGIRIANLEERRAESPDTLRKLYELVQETMTDVPMPVPYTRVSYEQWESTEMKNPSMIPEAYFIASDGSRFVGLTSLFRLDKEPRSLFQALTSVTRDRRGRGIAMALKLKGIEYARKNNYDRIKTMNDSDNAPMLAVNNKLGFKRQVGWITMEKNLS